MQLWHAQKKSTKEPGNRSAFVFLNNTNPSWRPLQSGWTYQFRTQIQPLPRIPIPRQHLRQRQRLPQPPCIRQIKILCLRDRRPRLLQLMKRRHHLRHLRRRDPVRHPPMARSPVQLILQRPPRVPLRLVRFPPPLSPRQNPPARQSSPKDFYADVSSSSFSIRCAEMCQKNNLFGPFRPLSPSFKSSSLLRSPCVKWLPHKDSNLG